LYPVARFIGAEKATYQMKNQRQVAARPNPTTGKYATHVLSRTGTDKRKRINHQLSALLA
jgi:hypothetical protein